MSDSCSGTGCNQDSEAGVRLVALNLPEDEGEGLGFRLTRTMWDPYPWVREVSAGGRAEGAGLKTGDCLLQADGKDLLGLPVGQVAGLIRGDGAGRGVSLLVWNCGTDPKDDPELLWSCGGGVRGERARRALSGVVRALACCVCAATSTRALCCTRSHLYCEGCWSRLERCALCREALPAKDSPYARNLVAEQVFEAIATEYEIKDAKRTTQSVSAMTTPNRSPNVSPAVNRRGQYNISMMTRHKKVQFNDKLSPNYASDPNIHRTFNNDTTKRPILNLKSQATQSENVKDCQCKNVVSDGRNTDTKIPQIKIEDAENKQVEKFCSSNCQSMLQNKLLERLRPACSLADLSNVIKSCNLSRSLNNINISDQCNGHHSGSLDNLKKNNSGCDSPVIVLSSPPIYLLACDHNKTE